MEPIWLKPDLADEIIKNDDIFEQTQSIVTGKSQVWINVYFLADQYLLGNGMVLTFIEIVVF